MVRLDPNIEAMKEFSQVTNSLGVSLEEYATAVRKLFHWEQERKVLEVSTAEPLHHWLNSNKMDE